MTDSGKQFYNEIDNILWNDWDPLGVNDIAPRDEYQSYVPIIFSLKINGADKDAMTKKLDEIATKEMGLLSKIEHCKQIAEKIISL